jgi:hypothetical protein
MKAVVCQLVEYSRIGTRIDKNNPRVLRNRVVITEAQMESHNADFETKQYVIDEDATKAYCANPLTEKVEAKK